MAKKPADPKVSEGARMERRSFRAYLRRQMIYTADGPAKVMLGEVLRWVLDRQKRYDQRAGGLGRR